MHHLYNNNEMGRARRAPVKSRKPRSAGKKKDKINDCKTSNGTPSTKTKKKDEKAANKDYTHWLMKSEPESRFEKGIDMKFGIEDLKAEPEQTACWDGVRNYAARNHMRAMKLHQQAFFYHSNCKEPGIAGIVEVVKDGYPDHTQFDQKDAHYDAKAKEDDPRWFMVDVKYKRMLNRFIPLAELKRVHLKHKANGGPLRNLSLFTSARLSVQPLTKEEWDFIISLEEND